jgi:hypothetical protein
LTGGDAASMLRGIWLDAPFGAPLPLLSRERIYFRCVMVSKPRTRCVARTLAYSSLPGLTRQSMRAGSNAQSNVLHVFMDHRVKPGGDEEDKEPADARIGDIAAGKRDSPSFLPAKICRRLQQEGASAPETRTKKKNDGKECRKKCRKK